MPKREDLIIKPGELASLSGAVIFDCRFSLADPQAGRSQYAEGHIPGAHYLHLNEDLSAAPAEHGGRHPLPDPAAFAATLARCGVDRETAVVAYDDSRFAFSARLWWLMRSLGYRPPRLLNGGLAGYVRAGGELSQDTAGPRPCAVPALDDYRGVTDIEGVRTAHSRGTVLVDSREAARYQGLEEPIDPVAGHIPGAVNLPWQGVTSEAGEILDDEAQHERWSKLLDEPLVVYCGSGVTACVNLFSLSLLGRDDATLYAGSWSDWCSYL